MKVKALIASFLVAMAATASAQQPDSIAVQQPDTIAKAKLNLVNVDISILAHGETRHGGLHSSTTYTEDGQEVETITRKSANFLTGKARIAIGYERPGIQASVVLQNMAVWGETSSNQLSLYEAWAKLTARFGGFLQVGRQALAYDDERIIGPNDWAMAAKSHDVIRLGYEGYNHKVHAILAFNQNSSNVIEGGSYYVNGSQPYKSMIDLWYHYDVPTFPLSASLLFMNVGMQGGDTPKEGHTEHQQLLGTYVTYQPDRWKFEGSAYHQFGKNENKIPIRAWLFALKATFHPTSQWATTIGYDYISGDRYFAVPSGGGLGLTRHSVIRGFNTVYGSHHKFYGAMDFFYLSTYYNGFTPGLQNVFVGAGYKPIPKLSLGAEIHYLATAANIDKLKPSLGYEIELAAQYEISSILNLTAGFSYMHGTETMEKLKRAMGDRRLYWGWISLTVSPRIISHRW